MLFKRANFLARFFPTKIFRPCQFFSTGRSDQIKFNYYNVLGISQSATQAEIKAAYLKKAKESHPDLQTTNKKEAEENFKKIVEAYTILSDETKKKDYDEALNPKDKPYSSSYSQSNYAYPNEKFHGKASSPKYDEDMFKEFHRNNIKNRMEHENNFWVKNIELIILTGLGVALYAKWLWMYSENEKARYSIMKSEEEHLDPREAEEEGIYVDYQIPAPKNKKLTDDDCEGLDIQTLENLDRMGYKLPNEAKERVMEFREAYRVHVPRSQRANSWNYNDVYNNRPQSTQASSQQAAPVMQAQPKRNKNISAEAEAVMVLKQATEGLDFDEEEGNKGVERSSLKNQNQANTEENVKSIPRMRTGVYQKEKNLQKL